MIQSQSSISSSHTHFVFTDRDDAGHTLSTDILHEDYHLMFDLEASEVSALSPGVQVSLVRDREAEADVLPCVGASRHEVFS